jgi:hypothetical protein
MQPHIRSQPFPDTHHCLAAFANHGLLPATIK